MVPRDPVAKKSSVMYHEDSYAEPLITWPVALYPSAVPIQTSGSVIPPTFTPPFTVAASGYLRNNGWMDEWVKIDTALGGHHVWKPKKFILSFAMLVAVARQN